MESLGIKGVSVSFCCHVEIFSDAMLEYDCKGIGVSNDGGFGTLGKGAATGCEFVAQPVTLTASISSGQSIALCDFFGFGNGLKLGLGGGFVWCVRVRGGVGWVVSGLVGAPSPSPIPRRVGLC